MQRSAPTTHSAGTQKSALSGNAKMRVGRSSFWRRRRRLLPFVLRLASYAMRVENCWTGSKHSPVYLIDKIGHVELGDLCRRILKNDAFSCTRERTMISSPRYNNSLLAAYSLGWLSVRLVGADAIRLSCQVRLCHVCDPECPRLTVCKPSIDAFFCFLSLNNCAFAAASPVCRRCAARQLFVYALEFDRTSGHVRTRKEDAKKRRSKRSGCSRCLHTKADFVCVFGLHVGCVFLWAQYLEHKLKLCRKLNLTCVSAYYED